MRTRPLVIVALVVAVLGPASSALAAEAPAGTLTIGVRVTLVNRWLDPAEAEGLITPFMVFYILHDALVKPMPGNLYAPSLAESWTLAKDGLTYEFVLRKNAKFHTGEPVTADDVKFSFARYRGSGGKLFKDKVKEVQVVAPNRVRIVLRRAPSRPIGAGHCSVRRLLVTIKNVETCKTAIPTNNVEVDDRGFIYIVDRANTGMHVLELTGEAPRHRELPVIPC